MENKEFILEALKRITPNTSWHGDGDLDNKSIKNIDILDKMLEFILEELFEDSIVPPGNKGNHTFEKIAEKKQKIIDKLKDTLEE